MNDLSPSEVIRIELSGATHDVEPGRSVAEVLRLVDQREPIVAATLDNHVVSLRTRLEADARVEPVCATDARGLPIVRRSAGHVMLAAAFEHDPNLVLSAGQSMLGGTFFRIEPPSGSSRAEQASTTRKLPELAAQLTRLMTELCERDLPFEHQSVAVEKAPSVLSDPRGTKARLLRAWPRPQVPVTSLLGFTDVTYGPYAPSTRLVAGARVVPFEDGLVLLLPGTEPREDPARDASLYRAFLEIRDWNERVGVATVGDLNLAVLEERSDDAVRVAEALQEKKLAQIADAITSNRDEVRVVCVAGPSSAGKTTFVRRLSVQLRVNGIEPIILGLDDYYRDRVHTPRDEDGEYDFEALEALDLDLIDAHLEELLAGGEVIVPRFDFEAGARAAPDPRRALRLRPDQVLLIEGIHSLNPRITVRAPGKARYRVFINALSQLVFDVHNRISTVDTRLLRRIVRDRRYRGTSAAETLARWPSVRRGEDRHIYPFQGEADVTFNSGLIYETSVLKTFAWRYLLEVPRDHPSRPEAYRLLRMLEMFVPVFPDDVPANSVLREFIGGSGFSY